MKPNLKVPFTLALPMLVLLLLPVAALVLAQSPGNVAAGVAHPLFWPAIRLSGLTSVMSLVVVVLLGLPLAWWLAHANSKGSRLIETLVDLPIVLPPAVVGIGLLMAFGRQGILGGFLGAIDIQIPFSTAAVVLAQSVVAAPFFVQAATSAFRRVDPEFVIVARTLGQSRWGTFFRVTLPLAAPGILGGCAMAWARALGEFGATLLFAGNMPGVTQTMPLAVYMSLESNLDLALALSLILACVGVALLLGIRSISFVWGAVR